MADVVAQALIFAMIAQCVLVISARKISKPYWPEVYLFILFLLSSILSYSAFINFKILVIPILIFMLIFVGANVFRDLRYRALTGLKPVALTFFQDYGQNKRWKIGLIAILGLILLIDGLYAAFPFYRPDQWNYHLIVAKQISLHSSLTQVPMLYDHIFFTGTYEYFFLLFRYFSDNDMVNQSAVNFFNWSVLIILFPPLIKRILNRFYVKFDLILCFGIIIFILFSIPSRVMLTNAKIEPVLLVTSMMLLSHVLVLSDYRSEKLSFFMGFLCVAPLATKLTWAHFMISFGLVLLLRGFKLKRIRLSIRSFFGGGLLGLITIVPFFFKNFLFFGNIFHPIQLSVFKSTYWSDSFNQYWYQVSGKATSTIGYFSELILVPQTFLYESKYFILVTLIGMIALRVGRHKSQLRKRQKYLVDAGLIIAMGFLCWPLFYRHDIYPRFYYGFVGVVAGCALILLAPLLERRASLFILILPAILVGQLEVKVIKMLSAYQSDVGEFYHAMGRTGIYQSDYNEINKHMSSFPETGLDSSDTVVLADDIQGYFLQGLILRWDSPDFFEVLDHWQDENPVNSGCIWSFLKDMNIRYLHAYTQSFANWPDVWGPVIARSEALGVTGRLRYLSGDIIAQQRIKCEDLNKNIPVSEQMLSSYTLKFSSGYLHGQFSKVIR